jgi:anion-transporting  ArsA/GET3 family ATPase
MGALLDRRLLVVTGKGGVGKTTVAAALGLLAAESGRRALVVEMGQQSRLAALFGHPPPPDGTELVLTDGLSVLSIDPEQALMEWLAALGGRVSARVLGASGTFQYFAAAAPGAREVVSMVKLWKLAGAKPGRRGGHDIVILDAPATGHALGLLRSPQTFGAIARVGPIARQTGEVHELLTDETRTAYLAVALGTEMAVTETIELREGLRATVDRDLWAVVVNGLLPRRFDGGELTRIEALAPPSRSSPAGAPAAVVGAAVRAAREVHERAAFQHGQVARLRRRGFPVIGLPFVWAPAVDLGAVEQLAGKLGRGLARAQDSPGAS